MLTRIFDPARLDLEQIREVRVHMDSDGTLRSLLPQMQNDVPWTNVTVPADPVVGCTSKIDPPSVMSPSCLVGSLSLATQFRAGQPARLAERA